MSTPVSHHAARDNRRHRPDSPPVSHTSREQLTVAELCAELKISRSTFYDWRAKGRAPRCLKLPNGDLRVCRGDLDTWLDACEGDL